jgi:hypothetical protein
MAMAYGCKPEVKCRYQAIALKTRPKGGRGVS